MINLLINFLNIFFIFVIIDFIIYIKDQGKINNIINSKNVKYKIKNTSFMKNISFYINYLDNMNISIFHLLKPFIIIIVSIVISVLSFIIAYRFLEIFSSALIISIYTFFIPYIFLQYLYNKYKIKILNIFPTYIISLKNYTNISNDIIIAMRKVNIDKPLMLFIDRFNLLIQKGISVYDGFEKLKSDINIKKISEFITALQNCYINGGDFSKLLDRYSKIITNINTQREKESQDNFSSILVLVILIIINIFLIINFVYSNITYKNIVINNFTGKIILNINILSYLLVFYFVKKLNKLED